MKVLIVGAGSIGKRRARLLAEMSDITLGIVDDDGERASDAAFECLPGHKFPEPGVAWVDTRWDESVEWLASAEPAAAFICTPAETHWTLTADLLRNRIPTFVEKPLDVAPENLSLDPGGPEHPVGVAAMGACNMRWASSLPVDRRWRRLVFGTSAPLSSWRPGAVETYREHGVILESAIHEMDVAYSQLGRIEDGEVDGTLDRCVIRLQHERGESKICADWSETATTERWVFGIDEDYRQHVALVSTSDDMYRAEMEHFLECVRTGERPCNTLADAAHVCGWAIRLTEQLREAEHGQ